jgi:hypothetical protein
MAMKPWPWRPVAILALGLVAWFGVPISRTLFGDTADGFWLQGLALGGAAILLVQEIRRPTPGRWKLLAWLGGLLLIAWAGGLLFLWLIWPK